MLVVKATQVVKAVIAKWNDTIPELSLASLVDGRSGLLRFLTLVFVNSYNIFLYVRFQWWKNQLSIFQGNLRGLMY